MRYSSNIDEDRFASEVVAASSKFVSSDIEGAQEHLHRAFEVLYEARKYFYPVDAFIIDLTFVDRSVLDDGLGRELAGTLHGNLLMPAELVAELAAADPRLFAELKAKLEAGEVAIAGGERHEEELPVLPPELIRASISSGLTLYEELLGRRPTVFARRRHGMLPILPQVLAQFGFDGAIHFTFDEGRFPLGSQTKIRWEGSDGSVIDALARLPHDAAKPETFLEFSRLMGDTMDTDHVATLILAHWPDHVSPWYQDLRRIARISPVLGRFVTVDEYFATTDSPGKITRFEADEYRAPYLKQAVAHDQADPISTLVRTHWQHSVAQAQAACAMMLHCLGGADDVARATDLEATAARFAVALASGTGEAAEGSLAVNPLSFTRQSGASSNVENQPSPPAPALPISLEVPSMGFAWAPCAVPATKKSQPIAEGNTLRNEFVEVVVSSTTGGIQSIHDYRRRSNRLSQQLAVRFAGAPPKPGDIWKNPDEAAEYSTMVADRVEITQAGPPMGQIISEGSLLDDRQSRVGRFRQSVALPSGSRVALVTVELDTQHELGPDPWTSYCAARFAWSDPDADFYRSVALARTKTDAKRLEAPHFFEIESPRGRLAILTGGLAYHRRVGLRMVDTLLQVRGETARSFNFGIAVGSAQPAAAAVDLTTPLPVVTPAASPSATTGWLFHLDARNVIATHWEPLAANPSSGGSEGFRVRLLETLGQAGAARLRACRPLTGAHRIDAQGNRILELPVDDDKIVLHFSAYEWLFVEATW